MRSNPRWLPNSWSTLGASLLLLGVVLVSGVALVTSHPPTPASPSPTYFATWHGNATQGTNKAPDVLVLPSPPAGTWWEITKIQLTATCPQPQSFNQSAFLFSRFVQNPSQFPGLADPNLDVLAHIAVIQGRTGTFVGAGGVGAPPSPSWDWTKFVQPVTLSSEVQIVLGSSLGIGNSATVAVDYANLGSAVAAVEYAHPSLNGATETFKIGPSSFGTKWYLENAFASIQTGSGGVSRQVSMQLEPTGQMLLLGTDYPYGVNVRNTGGYSTVQTGPALNQYGTQTVWLTPIWISPPEYILVSVTGGSSDQAMYAVGFAQVTT